MRIVHVEFFTLRCSIPNNFPKPTASFINDGVIFLRVHTDNGIVGVGEPSPYGAPLKDMVKILNEFLIPKWIGSDPLDISKLTYQNSNRVGYGNVGQNALIAGFSQALWDIYGKTEGKPVYKLINPNSNGIVKAYASSGMWYENTSLEDVVNEALSYFKEGFRFYKLRPETPLNAGNHLERNRKPPRVNIKRLINLLQKISLSTMGQLKIMVDAGCRLDFDQALYLGKAMEELECFFLEEPIVRDYHEISRLKKKLKIGIAGGENLVSHSQFVPWIDNNALDYLQPDSNLAGINEIIKIDKLAEASQLKIILHNWTNDINNAANVHLGAALKTCLMVEANLTYNPLKSNLLKEDAILLKKGEFKINNKPGLGVELNESVLYKYEFNPLIE